MPTSTGEFSLKMWKEVHTFFEESGVKFSDIEPATVTYSEIQAGAIDQTLQNEQDRVTEKYEEQRETAYQESKPSLVEGAKAVAVSAAVEGGATLVLAIVRKMKQGKRIQDFSQDDWIEILKEAGLGTAKGTVRGAVVYLATNYTATPAAVASSVVTAGFGIAQQGYLLRRGLITEQEFWKNAEMLSIESAVSAVSALLGEALIPVPVLGAVIGNVVGMFVYSTTKDFIDKIDQEAAKKYLYELTEHRSRLEQANAEMMARMEQNFRMYMDLLDATFDVDFEKSLEGSVALARFIGVPSEEILDSRDKIAAYFME